MSWVEVQEPKPSTGRWEEAPEEPIESMPVPLGGFDLGQGQIPQEIWQKNSKVVLAALKQTPYKTGEGILTTMDILGDAMRIPGLGFQDEAGREAKNRLYRNNALYLRGLANEMTPDIEEGSAEYYTYQVASNIFQNAPWVAAGLLTGGSVMPILAMSSMAAGIKHNDLIEEGYDRNTAKVGGIAYGIAEGLGEMLGFNSLMKLAKTGGVKTLMEYLIKEPLSEVATELMQIGVDAGYLKEDMSMKQIWSRLVDTALIAGITSPILGGIGRTMWMGANLGKMISETTAVTQPTPTQQPTTQIPVSQFVSDETLAHDTTKTIQTNQNVQQGDILNVDLSDVTLSVEELQEIETKLTEELDKEVQASTMPALTMETVQGAFAGQEVTQTEEALKWSQSVGRLFSSKEATHQGSKTSILTDVGQTPTGKTITEKEALKAGMTKAERASREAFRKGIASGRALALQSKLASTKTRIRELTGQARVKDLEISSLDALNEALAMAEKASKTAEREGKKEGTMTEHQRMVKLQKIKKNKERAIKELRNLKNYLKGVVKKVDKMSMPPEYRDMVKTVATNWDANALMNFMLADETLLLDTNQIEMMGEAGKIANIKSADDITLEHLRNIVSIVKQLIFQGRAYNKITKFNQKIEVARVGEEIKQEIEDNFKVEVPEPPDLTQMPTDEEAPRMEEKKSWRQRAKDMCDASFNNLVKAEYFAEWLDGWKKMGRVWNAIVRPILESENHSLARAIRFRERMGDAIKLLDNINQIMSEKYMEINGQWLTKENAIMIALNSVHPDNMRQLVYGNRFSPANIQKIVSSLTENERKFVVEILDIINSQRDEMSATYREITGERLQLVDGIYFPIVVSRELNERIAEAGKIKNMLVDVVARASVNRSMTIARKVNTKNAVKLDLTVITDHLAATNLFITHGVAVRDVSKILANRDVKASIQEALGDNVYSQFNKWLKDIANPHYEALRGWDTFIGMMRRNATTAILGLSLSVSILQPTAIFSTISRLGPVKTLRGLFDFYRQYGENLDDIYAMSPFMYQRMASIDLDIRRQIEEDKDPLWKGNHIKESFYWMIQFFDKMATAPTWWATYMDEMRQHGDKNTAILMADKMVRNTQGSAMPKDLAEIQKGNNTRKAFVMFYTFFSAQFNEMNKSVQMTKMGVTGPQEILKSFFWIMFMPALFSVLLKRREKLLDDDAWWWEIMKGTVGYASAFIPVVGGVVNSLTEGFTFRPSPLISIPQEAIWAAQKAGKAVETGEDKEWYGFGKHSAMLAGYLFGLPMRQAILATDVAVEYYNEGEADLGSLVYKKAKK